MSSGISGTTDKRLLRKEFTARRKALTAETRAVYDAAICNAVRQLPAYRKCDALAAFVSFGAEPDLSSLFPGKRLLLPRFIASQGVYEMVAVKDLKLDLLPGKYGIPEPAAFLPAADPGFVASRALFLVPAVACDRRGTRLGRGGGYYDRLLMGVKIPPVAVIYHCQLSENALPGTAHDVPMGVIVTEREVITVSGQSMKEKEK